VSLPDPPRRIILVVDDEPGVRRLACQMLEREGFKTIEAETGRQALAALVSHPGRISLVVSDVRMPEMNGIELEQAIREEWPALPVILISGEITREWVTRLVREVPLRLLRKPFEQGELLEKVRELLGEGARPDEEPRMG
jgi:two-component system, cell cycle sensor histidine kinase and response regulator CckA